MLCFTKRQKVVVQPLIVTDMEKNKKTRIPNRGRIPEPERVLSKQFKAKYKTLKESELGAFTRVLFYLGGFYREPLLNTDWDKGFLWGCYVTALDSGIIDLPPEWEGKDPIHELTRFNRSVLVTREEHLEFPCRVSQKKREYESEFDARPIMQAEFAETKERHLEKGDEITLDYISSESAFIKVGDIVYQWQIEDLV